MNRLARPAAALLIALLMPTTASAEFLRVEMKTLGMDWAVCAHAVRVAMQKLPGVETVDVSLTKAVTDVRFRPGNTVTLDQLRQVIKNGGFKPGDTQVTAIGKLVRENTRLALELAPAKAALALAADPAHPAAFAEAQKFADAAPVMVEVNGEVVQGETLRLKSITRK